MRIYNILIILTIIGCSSKNSNDLKKSGLNGSIKTIEISYYDKDIDKVLQNDSTINPKRVIKKYFDKNGFNTMIEYSKKRKKIIDNRKDIIIQSYFQNGKLESKDTIQVIKSKTKVTYKFEDFEIEYFENLNTKKTIGEYYITSILNENAIEKIVLKKSNDSIIHKSIEKFINFDINKNPVLSIEEPIIINTSQLLIEKKESVTKMIFLPVQRSVNRTRYEYY